MVIKFMLNRKFETFSYFQKFKALVEKRIGKKNQVFENK